MTYALPHPLDRPGQQEAFDWLMSSKKKYLIIRAPTGSGKSAWAAEASKILRTIVLVKTKSLQSTNYNDSYGFDILYGKANYRCDEEKMFTAFDCGNPDCNCAYNLAVGRCLESPRVSLNYAKYLMSGTFVKNYEPDILFLDEAHNLRDITKDFIGLTIKWDDQFIQYEDKPKGPMQLSQAEALHYFNNCLDLVEGNNPGRGKDLENWRKWKRLNQRLQTVAAIINLELKDWYFEADSERLLIKPLSAKYHFKRLFGKAPKVVLMSATIRPSIAERLGIREDEYDYYEVPNPWPSPMRLVYDLGCPRMNFKCTDDDRYIHAHKIASVLSRHKSGIIHVSSKWQAKDLADRLFEFGVETWLPEDGIGTDRQLKAWYNVRRPGLYCISWAFHEGVDLGEDNISIMAKVPYASIGSEYDKAVADYDKAGYYQDAADMVEQACGRIRRGKKEHYGNGKQVFIADGSWQAVKKWLSEDFKKAIRKWGNNASLE